MDFIASAFTTCFGKKQIKCIMGGLDAVGKTTILYMLKLGEVVTTIPTIGFNIETFVHDNVNYTLYDMRNGDKIRGLRQFYYEGSRGIIYVIDSTDRDNVKEAKEDLADLLHHDHLKDAIILIFANKQDLPNAMTKEELKNMLNLDILASHTWYLQPASAITGEGLYEGLDWLSNEVENKLLNKKTSH